jgi:hypothetical protein
MMREMEGGEEEHFVVRESMEEGEKTTARRTVQGQGMREGERGGGKDEAIFEGGKQTNSLLPPFLRGISPWSLSICEPQKNEYIHRIRTNFMGLKNGIR